MLEDSDFQTADIVILPPEDATKSDQDSGPEDDDGVIGNLSGNQLRAEAEAVLTVAGFHKQQLETALLADDNVDSNDDLPLIEVYGKKVDKDEINVSRSKRRRHSATSTHNSSACATTPLQQSSKKRTAPPPPRQWVKCDLKQSENTWNSTPTPINDHTPASLFELFYDDVVIDHITKMSNLYALQNLKHIEPQITLDVQFVVMLLAAVQSKMVLDLMVDTLMVVRKDVFSVV
ncbi:hypothetical protein HELRODRAFT_171198 [Helobdella robusta]|uniref:PiggyBac transposable element-derived protein domain-containing protein n=1 Tax=Helobdella robusta TaxID=6412 RepID=T1F3X5_HELRO|nr:hypothetical protein HELRODRAFT_171198 [Helobdella robusta]ESO05558.1 hypothetical protein HELRODRAFT_171198 [Helobdella robusta]